MKLKTLRAVHVDLPVPRPKTPARRAPWPESSPRAMPINYYPQFSRQPQDMPGNVGLSEVWVPGHRRGRHFRTRKVFVRTARRIVHRPCHRGPSSRVKIVWLSS